jgi:hypothetical protein
MTEAKKAMVTTDLNKRLELRIQIVSSLADTVYSSSGTYRSKINMKTNINLDTTFPNRGKTWMPKKPEKPDYFQDDLDELNKKTIKANRRAIKTFFKTQEQHQKRKKEKPDSTDLTQENNLL